MAEMNIDIVDYRKNARKSDFSAQTFAYVIFLLYFCSVKSSWTTKLIIMATKQEQNIQTQKYNPTWEAAMQTQGSITIHDSRILRWDTC